MSYVATIDSFIFLFFVFCFSIQDVWWSEINSHEVKKKKWKYFKKKEIPFSSNPLFTVEKIPFLIEYSKFVNVEQHNFLFFDKVYHLLEISRFTSMDAKMDKEKEERKKIDINLWISTKCLSIPKSMTWYAKVSDDDDNFKRKIFQKFFDYCCQKFNSVEWNDNYSIFERIFIEFSWIFTFFSHFIFSISTTRCRLFFSDAFFIEFSSSLSA